MSLSKTLYPLLSTGSAKEDLSRHDGKIVDWDVKNQNKQANTALCGISSVSLLLVIVLV